MKLSKKTAEICTMDPGYKNLKVYQLAYRLAMEIFEITKKFPKEERFDLITQIRRSSRSACANITEGYRKRIYPKHFTSKMSDSDGECSETVLWLDFSKDCGYIASELHESLVSRYEEVGRMLGSMMANPHKFLPRPKTDPN